MAHSATHNPARTGRPAKAGRVRARIALVLLVGITLTSICQGHDKGEHRIAPHLAILGEAGHAGEAAQAVEPHAEPHARTGPGPMYTVVGPGALGAHDVASLGVALPLLALLGLSAGRRWPRPTDTLPQVTTTLPPDPPPPRQV